MKILPLLIALTCFCDSALAGDLATPTPTPTVYPRLLGRPGSLLRQERFSRRNTREAASESRAQTRAREKADRRSTAATQAQAREAARARERAQREVTAENRTQAKEATPRATSDLMTRMGFSEQEISAQKARETTATPTPGPKQ